MARVGFGGSGVGVYYWPNGDKYEGQWENDKKNGKGKAEVEE